MPLFECPVCHGRYHDPDVGAIPYYHTCPSLSVAELLALLPGEVHALVPGLPTPFTRADLERALFSIDVPRPGRRDERPQKGAITLVHPIDPNAMPTPQPAIQDQPPRILRGP